MDALFHRKRPQRVAVHFVHRKAQAWLIFCTFFAAIFFVGCSPTKSVVVLLPDAEGRVGDLRVCSSKGEIALDKAYQSVAFDPQSKSGPSAFSMEKWEVVNRFGDALAAEPEMPSRIDFFTLYYQTDSVELTSDSSRSMDAVIASLKKADVLGLYVVGHADRLGSKRYNRKLSQKRAVAMKNMLVAGGIRSDRIRVSFLGETDPQIETDDEVEESLNRRVRIVVKRQIETSD
jgi:outer membrane protein OmpA-like peptidoglycan-associated protein